MYHHLRLDKHLQFPQELFLAHGFQIFPSPTLDSSNMPLLHIKILYLEPNRSPKYHLTLWDSKTMSSHFLDTSRLALRGIFFHTLDFKWPTQNPRFFPGTIRFSSHHAPILHLCHRLLSEGLDMYEYYVLFSYSRPLFQPITFLWLSSLSSSTLFILHRFVGHTFCVFIQIINKSSQWNRD